MLDPPDVQGSARRLGRGLRIGLAGFVVLVALGIGRGPLFDREDAVTAYVGVDVFDGARVRPGMTVVVRGAAIAAVGDDVEVPAGAEIIEGRSRTLLPGFVDAHVHLGLVDPRTVLRHGVTAARDLGWPLEDVSALLGGVTDPSAGPALRFAGPMLTAPGGYPARAGWAPAGTALEVATRDEAARAVADLARRGASVIKVALDPRGPTLASDVLRAIVRAADDAGLRVTCHCASLALLRRAVEAGVGEFAHFLWSDERIPDDLIATMVARDIVVVPTLHIDPSRARIDNLRRFVAAGGTVVYGTDMGNPPAAHGIDTEELRLMTEAGMTPAEAIAAATSRAAEYLGLPGGAIREGAPADLVLVDGDPLEDLSVLAEPLLVMRAGVFAS